MRHEEIKFVSRVNEKEEYAPLHGISDISEIGTLHFLHNYILTYGRGRGYDIDQDLNLAD